MSKRAPKRTKAADSAYTASDNCSNPVIKDALKHSKKRKNGKRIASTDMEFDPASKQAYDENYEAIFGKRDIPHGT